MMIRGIRQRLTYANMMATVAVFVALGGGAYAVVGLKRDSVRSGHIKDGQVRSRDIADHTIAAGDLKRSLLAGVSGSSGDRGPAGDRGQAGEPGPQGLQGAAGQTGETGPAGPRGAAIVASLIGGNPVTATSGSYGANIVLLTWTQPAGALDEIRGYFSVNWPNGCNDDGDAIEARFTDQDNSEISVDLPDAVSVAGNGGTNDFADISGVRFTHGGLNGEIGTDFVVPLPIEKAQFAPPNTGEVTRSVKVQVKRLAGCTVNTSLSGWRIWVTRFQAG